MTVSEILGGIIVHAAQETYCVCKHFSVLFSARYSLDRCCKMSDF